MKRGVLVTGADAPLGERLVRALLADPEVGHVLAVGSRPLGDALPLEDERRLTYLSVNLARERRVQELLFGPARDLGVEVVVHTSMGSGAAEKGKAVHVANVDATRDLLALCERHPTIHTFVLRSYAEVYQVQADLPVLIGEEHPINLHPNAPQYVRDRVEADLGACVRMGLSRLRIVVLRCAEVLTQGTGSQLYDYLDSPFCFRPIGYDPMVNLLSVADAVGALARAASAPEQGVFNVPGFDTLPLSLCIAKWGRVAVPVPGSWMTPLYRWRRQLRGHDFSYGMNRRRFHYSGVLDGRRARLVLGYAPHHPIDWPAAG